MADSTGKDSTGGSELDKTSLEYQYQQLQKKLSASQARAKQLVAENARLSADNTSERIETLLTGFFETLSGELAGGATKERLEQLKSQAKSSKETAANRAKARSELAQLTEGMEDAADIDKLVAQGDMDGALTLARSRLDSSKSTEMVDIDKLIDQRLAERESKRVNTGQSTVATKEEKDDDVIAADTYKMGRKELAEQREKLLAIGRKQMLGR